MQYKIILLLFLKTFCIIIPSEHLPLHARPHSAPPITIPSLYSSQIKKQNDCQYFSTKLKDLEHIKIVAARLRQLVEDEPKTSFSLHPNPQFGLATIHPPHFIRYKYNRTNLHEAALANDPKRTQETITDIVFYERDNQIEGYIEQYIDLKDQKGKAALWYAIQGNCIEIAQQLLHSYASIYTTNKKKETLLHLAIQQKDSCAISLICQHEKKELLYLFNVLKYKNRGYHPTIESFANKPALSLIAFKSSQGKTPIDLCYPETLKQLKEHVLFVSHLLATTNFPRKLKSQLEATLYTISFYSLLYKMSLLSA